MIQRWSDDRRQRSRSTPVFGSWQSRCGSRSRCQGGWVPLKKDGHYIEFNRYR